MSVVRLRSALLLGFALPLGACHSIFGLNLTGRASVAPPVRISAVTAPDRKTMDGRELLAAGQPGAAIEAFVQALNSGEAAAPAVNGLGVAYARIGRFDLARRFFQEAALLDPDDVHFRANLALLTQTEEAERRRAIALQAQDVPTPSQPLVAGRMERVSRGAVTIATLAPDPSDRPVIFAASRPVAPAAPLPTTKLSRILPKQVPELARKRTAAAAVPATVRVSSPTFLRRSARGEIQVVTTSPGAGSSTTKLADLKDSFRPLVRIELPKPASTNARGIIRITLPETQPVRARELAISVQRRNGAARK